MMRWKVHSALIFSNLIYGVNYGVAKAVMPHYIAPLGFIFTRVFFGSILFWAFNATVKNKEKIAPKDFPRLVLCGLLGVAANQLLFFEGLNLTSPINASLIQTIIPVILLPIGALMLQEKITLRKILGVLMGLTGAALLILNKQELSLENSGLTGDLLIILNATCYAFYLVLVKPLMAQYSAPTVIKWVFFFGMLVIVPFGWNSFFEISWLELPATAWMAIIYVVLFTTFFAYLFNTWALKHVNSSVVGIYAYMQPVFASLIAMSLGQDVPTIETGLYSLLIFVGVYLVSIKKKPQQAARTEAKKAEQLME